MQKNHTHTAAPLSVCVLMLNRLAVISLHLNTDMFHYYRKRSVGEGFSRCVIVRRVEEITVCVCVSGFNMSASQTCCYMTDLNLSGT